LFGNIGGVSFVVLEGIAEIFGIVELFLAVLQVEEHFLHLKEQVLFSLLLCKERVFGGGDGVPEEGHHEELLHEAVHVANAPQVLETHIATPRFHFVLQSYDPVVHSPRSPLSLPVECA
jgi:hypothetical protein